MIEKPVNVFLNDLSSSSATPGGGSAAALIGSMGAALVSMVANLTKGKKKYESVEKEVLNVLDESELLRVSLQTAIQSDVEAFNNVMAAYSLPKETDEEKTIRSSKIQNALRKTFASSLHPTAAFIKSLISQEDFFGNELDYDAYNPTKTVFWGDTAMDYLTPLIYSGLLESIELYDSPLGPAAGFAGEFVGIGNSYMVALQTASSTFSKLVAFPSSYTSYPLGSDEPH